MLPVLRAVWVEWIKAFRSKFINVKPRIKIHGKHEIVGKFNRNGLLHIPKRWPACKAPIPISEVADTAKDAKWMCEDVLGRDKVGELGGLEFVAVENEVVGNGGRGLGASRVVRIDDGL